MKGDEDIDALARKLLYNDAVIPSDAVWARLEAQLPGAPNRFSPIYWLNYFYIGLVLLLLSLVGAYAYFQKFQGQPHMRQYTERTIGIDSLQKGVENQPAAQIAATPKTVDMHAVEMLQVATPVLTSRQGTQYAITRAEDGHTHTKSEIPHGGVAGHSFPIAAPLSHTGARSHAGWEMNLPGAGLGIQVMEERENMTPLHSLGLSQNIQVPGLNGALTNVDYGPMHRRRWLLGLYTDIRSTSMRIYTGPEGMSALVDSLRAVEFPAANMGAGIQVGYHIHPRWRLSSGLAFAKWCRTTTYPVHFEVPTDYLNTGTASGVSVPLQETVLTATGYQAVGIRVPSALVTNALQANTTTDYPQEIKLKECFEFLQFPLMVEYHHTAGRWGILPGAGMAYEYILSRSEQLLGDGLDGSVKLLNGGQRGYLSFSGSIHAEYWLTEQLAIRTGASYRAWLTPIYQNELIKTYPQVLSIDAGIIYTLRRGRL